MLATQGFGTFGAQASWGFPLYTLPTYFDPRVDSVDSVRREKEARNSVTRVTMGEARRTVQGEGEFDE